MPQCFSVPLIGVSVRSTQPPCKAFSTTGTIDCDELIRFARGGVFELGKFPRFFRWRYASYQTLSISDRQVFFWGGRSCGRPSCNDPFASHRATVTSFGSFLDIATSTAIVAVTVLVIVTPIRICVMAVTAAPTVLRMAKFALLTRIACPWCVLPPLRYWPRWFNETLKVPLCLRKKLLRHAVVHMKKVVHADASALLLVRVPRPG